VRAAARGEEHPHDGTSRYTEQDSHGASYPLPLSCGLTAEAQQVGAAQRQQEPRVEDENRRALDPAADRVETHRIRGRAGHGADGKEQPLQPFAAGAAGQDPRQREPRRWSPE
jgi:hypothetical protein